MFEEPIRESRLVLNLYYYNILQYSTDCSSEFYGLQYSTVVQSQNLLIQCTLFYPIQYTGTYDTVPNANRLTMTSILLSHRLALTYSPFLLLFIILYYLYLPGCYGTYYTGLLGGRVSIQSITPLNDVKTPYYQGLYREI